VFLAELASGFEASIEVKATADVASVFPEQVVLVLDWNGAMYVPATTIEPKRAYWAAARRTTGRAAYGTLYIDLDGDRVTDPFRQVTDGWHLIGPVQKTIKPQGPLVEALAWFWNVYWQAPFPLAEGDEMQLGLGYWLRAHGDTTILLGDPPGNAP